MREIQSIHNRMAGEPTFKDRRLTIGNMLTSLARGLPLQAFAEDYCIDVEHCNAALKDIAQNLQDWMRPKVQWELWKSDEEVSYTFGPSTSITSMFASEAMPKDSKRVWVVEARSYIEAQTKYHEYMGWEPYRPMDDSDSEMYGDIV